MACVLASYHCLEASLNLPLIPRLTPTVVSGAFRLFICLWHAINPAHPSRRQKEKVTAYQIPLFADHLWRRLVKVYLYASNTPKHAWDRGQKCCITKIAASPLGTGATDCKIQYLEHPMLHVRRQPLRRGSTQEPTACLVVSSSLYLNPGRIILSGASYTTSLLIRLGGSTSSS